MKKLSLGIASLVVACLIPIVLEGGFPRVDVPLTEKTFSSR
jgi:hypothetical protein